ncbi:MAG: type II toxin-antitoxin system Phd/YefM family antitoxin [Thermodesulfovibrionales bacterium]|jgi:prevent-host-death family protein
MLVNTEKMIPVTKLQRHLTQRLREVHETGEPLFILRNNEMAAVILSTGEYELLKQAEDILEHFEIAETVEKRLKGYDRSKNISWDKIKKKHGL